MTKEQLITLGLDEEMAQKIVELSKAELKELVPKTQMDELTEAKKQLDAQLKERDKQLIDLKKAAGDVEGVKTKIEELQTANKTAKADYEEKLKDLQFTNAIKLAIAAEAQDVDLVAGLFDKSKLILGDDGKITGLDEQLKSLKENKAFLFKEANTSIHGGKPAAGSGRLPEDKKLTEMTYTEMCQYLAENPGSKLE